MMLPRLLLAVAVSLAGLPACLGSEGSGLCIDDEACPSGPVCAFGACIDPRDQRLSAVDLVVEPSISSGLPTQIVQDVNARAAERVDIAVRGGVLVEGRVEHQGAPLSARVWFEPATSLSGRARPPSTATELDGSFSLILVDQERYTLGLSDDSAGLPPFLQTRDFVVDGASADRGVIDVPAPTVSLIGRIVAGIGAAMVGIPELEVRVLEGAQRVSSNATTSETGEFTLLLMALPTDPVLEVRPSVRNASFPTLRLPVDVVGTRIDLGDLSLGDVAAPVPIAGRVVAESGAPVPLASVVALAKFGAGEFTAHVQTDGEGALALALLPGTYSVAVLGPTEAGGAGLVIEELVVSGPITDLLFTLPGRAPVEGRVLDAAGRRVPAASLTFQRLGNDLGVAEPVLGDGQPSFVISADSDGSFVARVDPGRYRLTIQPPVGLAAPGQSVLITVPAQGVERDFSLPPRAVLAGTVVDRGGARSGGAFIRVYSRLLDEAGRAIFLGEALAADDGSFEVSLPDFQR